MNQWTDCCVDVLKWVCLLLLLPLSHIMLKTYITVASTFLGSVCGMRSAISLLICLPIGPPSSPGFAHDATKKRSLCRCSCLDICSKKIDGAEYGRVKPTWGACQVEGGQPYAKWSSEASNKACMFCVSWQTRSHTLCGTAECSRCIAKLEPLCSCQAGRSSSFYNWSRFIQIHDVWFNVLYSMYCNLQSM